MDPKESRTDRRTVRSRRQPRFRAFQTSSLGHCRAHSGVTYGYAVVAPSGAAGARSGPRRRSRSPAAGGSSRRSRGETHRVVSRPLEPVQPEVRTEQPIGRRLLGVGRAQHQDVPLTRKISRPPGRSRRAASGTQRYGSAQMLAPYSEIARSKLASGRGTVSALPWMQREVEPVLGLEPARRRELRLGVVDADRPRAAPRQPGRDVAGPAAELDRVEAVEVVRQEVEPRTRGCPRCPTSPRPARAPAALAVGDVVGGPAVPRRPVAADVVGQILGSATGHGRRGRGAQARRCVASVKDDTCPVIGCRSAPAGAGR